MSFTVPYFGNFDFNKLTLSAPLTENGKTKVKVTNSEGRVPYLNLVEYTNRPLAAKFPMDAPTADGDPDRRTQTLSIGDGELFAAVKKFDTYVMNYAVKHSEQLFGKKMTFEQIEQRYERMEKNNERFPGAYIKMKIKIGGSKVPTKLYEGADTPWENDDVAPRVEPGVLEESACRFSPVISIPQLWVIGKGSNARFGAQIQAESAYVWAGNKRSACAMHSNFAPSEEPETKKQATGSENAVALLPAEEPEIKSETKETKASGKAAAK